VVIIVGVLCTWSSRFIDPIGFCRLEQKMATRLRVEKEIILLFGNATPLHDDFFISLSLSLSLPKRMSVTPVDDTKLWKAFKIALARYICNRCTRIVVAETHMFLFPLHMYVLTFVAMQAILFSREG
jgi:hypothetical protein